MARSNGWKSWPYQDVIQMPNKIKAPAAELSKKYLDKIKQNRKEGLLCDSAEIEEIKTRIVKFTRVFPQLGRILYLRYVEDESFPAIACEMEKSVDWMWHQHTTALIRFSPYVPKGGLYI